MELGIVGVAAITIIAFLAGHIWKSATPDNLHKWIPSICGLLGLILDVVAFVLKMPDFPANDVINAMAIGVVSGLAATGAHQVGHQLMPDNDKESDSAKEARADTASGDEAADDTKN